MKKHLVYTTYGENSGSVYRTQVIELLNHWSEIKKWDITLIQIADYENFTGLDERVARISIQRKNKILNPKDLISYSHEISSKFNIFKGKVYFSSRGVFAFNIMKKYIDSNKIIPEINNLDVRGISEEFKYSYKRILLYPILDLYFKKTIRKANSITAVTNSLKEYLVTKYNIKKEKIHVVPTLSVMSYTPTNDKRKDIAYVGKIAWVSQEKFLQNIKKIIEIIPEDKWKIGFFGTSNVHKELKKHNIKIYNRMPPEELSIRLSKYHTGLVLRDNSIVNKVAAPCKISDYLCMGFPILYSGTIGSIQDFIKKNPEANRFIINIENERVENNKIKTNLLLEERERAYIAELAKEYFGVEAVMNSYIKAFTIKIN